MIEAIKKREVDLLKGLHRNNSDRKRVILTEIEKEPLNVMVHK
jgi:hypothetical protein